MKYLGALLTLAIALSAASCSKTTNMNRLDFRADTRVIYLSRRPIPDDFFARVDYAEETAAILMKLKKIEKIDNLGGVPELNLLYLSDNLIKRIESLDSIPRLILLDLSYNQITEIEDLDNLPLLRILDLSYNQIGAVRNLGRLKNLQLLNLSGNKVSHLANLESLESLRTLNLDGNPLQSVSLPTLTFLTSRNVEILYNETNYTSRDFFAENQLLVVESAME